MPDYSEERFLRSPIYLFGFQILFGTFVPAGANRARTMLDFKGQARKCQWNVQNGTNHSNGLGFD
jgi:hypothetical protein